MDPPNNLEENIVMELRNRNLISRASDSRALTRLAAAFLILVLGGTVGYFLGSDDRPTAPVEKNPRFVLLLHEIPDPAEDTEAMVSEYGRWARSIHSEGRFINGEKLKLSGRILARSSGEPETSVWAFPEESEILSGFFIIEAANYEEAAEIAAQCPHLKYGGTIELREIDPT